MMITLLCALLSGAAFYLSIQVGAIWPLAWIAPIPVLWLAFSDAPRWKVMFACWAAYAIGMCNMLPPYFGMLPAQTLIVSIALPGLGLGAIALAARRVSRRLSPLAGAAAFAALWTSVDYALSFGPDGTAASWAYSQVGAPALIQSASVFGIWPITFMLTFFSAGIAAAVASRKAAPAIAALVLFAVNAGFGVARIVWADEGPSVRVGLGADDALAFIRPDAAAASKVVDAYLGAAGKLAADGASLIVFPEKDAMLLPAYRDDVVARLSDAARTNKATIVMGFDDQGKKRLNVALIFTPDGAPPQIYAKRHMVPGLETMFALGKGGFMLPDKTGVAICKDMDFPRTLRADAAAAHPTLLAVPAWDFEGDRWWHARLAIMRSVEEGFALARAAKDGLLTLSDAYGRVIAKKPTQRDGMATLVGDIPRGPGRTIYNRIGDVFAWGAIALAMLFFGAAFFRRRR